MGIFGSSMILGNAACRPIICDYSNNATWCCCTGISSITVITIGGGGGGGDGIALNTTCAGDAVLGAAGGGGGGISCRTFPAACFGATGSIIVGGGGARCNNGQAGNGGASIFSSCSVYVRSGGGKGGYSGQDVPAIYEPFPSNVVNGGLPCAGGTGTYSAGNDGGQAWIRCVSSVYCQDGTDGGNLTNTTRGGAGGGSATYWGVGCGPLVGVAGSASTAYTILGIDLTSTGKGGNGGNSRVCCSLSGRTDGTVGGAGLVRIIQNY
jgi:hypothetical protein